MNKCIDTEIQEMLPDLLHRRLADGDRERGDCDHGEARLPAHTADAVGEILPEAFDPGEEPDGAGVFASERDVAHGASGS